MSLLLDVYGLWQLVTMIMCVAIVTVFFAIKVFVYSERREWRRNLLSPRRDAAVQQRMVDSYYDKKSGYLRG